MKVTKNDMMNKFHCIDDNMTVRQMMDNHPDDFTAIVQELMIKYVTESYHDNYEYKFEFIDLNFDSQKIYIEPNHPLTESMEENTLVPYIGFKCGNRDFDVDKAMDVMDEYQMLCNDTHEPIWECNCAIHYAINYPEEVA